MHFEGHSSTVIKPTKSNSVRYPHWVGYTSAKSSAGLKSLLLLPLQCCRNSQTPFLIRAGVAGCHPNRTSHSRVHVSHPDPGCIHHHHFTSREERPTGLREEPRGTTPLFPSLLPWHLEPALPHYPLLLRSHSL